MSRRLDVRPVPVIPAGVRLRTFGGPDDVDLWLALRDRAFARQRLGVQQWNREDFEREFLSRPWWRPDQLWFAETNAFPQLPLLAWQPVGTVTLALRGDGTHAKPVAHWLAVLPSGRRRGIGRLLMATLEACCWDAGQREVWLETHTAWSAAVAFYRTLGYRPVTESTTG